jgi:hypothetical protein
MNVVDDHFDRELGASGAARCGMLVTAMLMIMQKRLPGPNGQSGTWIRSIVMKRAVEGERDRADCPVGAVDVKLAVHGEQVELMLAAGQRAAACHPVVPESSKKSISPPAAHGLLVPSAHQAGHTPASGVTMMRPSQWP